MAEAAAAADHSRSQGNFISSDPETLGFDLSSGAKWIYPENYPRRDYQFNIVQTALYNNTLVCLPTGLGKTFIAAVVMYNFWRWYPRGRIVFLAPTKPLVAQQINACHEIMGIPSEQTVELTGTVNRTKRAAAWQQKRVIFATPQTFQKDLQNDYVPCELIKCIVMDEAHKALGKHSYCEIVRMVGERSKFFRVLALSATPGSKIDHVRQVIQNLLISELELRDDTSSDITPYTNDRSMEKIIVNLDNDLTRYRDRYINIMDPHVRILVRNHILQGSTANITRGRIFMLTKQYESRPNKAQNHGIIMKTLNILLTMYHAYELLLKHGLRAFHHFYSNHSDKYWLDAEIELKLMLEDIKIHIGDFPVIQPSNDETFPDIPQDLVFGHSKFKKLQDLLVDHFKSFSLQNKGTRAIVFVEYRDIVNEVYVLLLQTRPLIRPQMFVGQAGQKQKQQLAALENFRNNKVNVLISTSVGEEGLDVGEVDLIVCFDISTSTPTRLVQRMGRTGRKRSGRVVLLLTEGREVQTLNQAMSKKDSLNSKVLQSSNIASSLYQSSPRMLPRDVAPECLAMFIKAQPKTPKARGRRVGAPRGAAAERKARKAKDLAARENDDCSSLPSTPESAAEASLAKPACIKDKCAVASNQPSMTRFLTDQRQPKKSLFPRDTDSGFSEEFQLPESRDNPYSFIRPHEVKLLTSDSHALEFLTLCAMSRSSKESSASPANGAPETHFHWAPAPGSATTEHALGDPTIPSAASLDCIRNLAPSERPSLTDVDDEPRGPVDEGTPGAAHHESQASSPPSDPDGTSQQRAASPATVEVDFEQLLEECTGSEASPPARGGNIFDDLLEGGWSSDDGGPPAQRPDGSREKRRRSASPGGASPPKKRALRHAEPDSPGEDSQEDIFEGLDSDEAQPSERGRAATDSPRGASSRAPDTGFAAPPAPPAPRAAGKENRPTSGGAPRGAAEGARRERERRRRLARGFIEDEARASSGRDSSDGSADEGLERDAADDSFVSYSQDARERVDMRAHYLRTIGNLPARRGAFLIKRGQRLLPDAELFSQVVSREEREEDYVHDSFCVGDEARATTDDGSGSEESLLERIESSLESRRRKTRRQRRERRLRFRCPRRGGKESLRVAAADDSSEDETEMLRKQVMEESVVLKR